MIESPEAQLAREQPAPAGHAGFRRWYGQGLASAMFRPPNWNGLAATPGILAALVAAGIALAIILERLYIDGPARFYWQAAAHGWFGIALTAWAAYLLRPRPLAEAAAHGRSGAPGAAHLLCMMLAQSQVIMLVIGLMYAWLLHAGLYSEQTLGRWGLWAAWLLPVIWGVPAQLLLLWRSGGAHHPDRMILAAIAVAGAAMLPYYVRPVDFWHPIEDADIEAQRAQLELTQETMEAQPKLLTQRLSELQPQRSGVIDLYSITFAPYAEEDVFLRESTMVSEVMAKRFDAAGRTVQLVNNVSTTEQWPWATPLNLKRAIKHVAGLMNREEDVLFLHLTSHGARNGELAADFWPMAVSPVRPDDLKTWLDEAGIKYRVISISACYSGSWIAPLAGEQTLVVTAADANHTSYGCGRHSELTFFGRAMYDEQLRKETLSFEQAHAAAREIIRQREKEAGKDDGYSNPQISAGPEIRKHLTKLQQRLGTPSGS